MRRGSLVIADKVAERIAAKAARDTVGVQPRTAALDKLTGRELPRVTVMISADRVRAAVHVAVPWPYPLTEVTAAVRDNVAAALSEMAGLHVDGVDVAVSSVVAGDGTGRTRILR
ncbi:MAG: Asp23/Gls24 family envelope stress response protein [Mycobacteriaceae bacterium]|nr:Asp23/Gls24 family envelope stress response protein [Mycobacteriaceae bacterium]